MPTHEDFPRYAHVQGQGRCQVLGYDHSGYFFLLNGRDDRLYRHRSTFTFLPENDQPADDTLTQKER